jgi:beta-ureidopropionase / N-carbamoyl-L-amino-acid hydrolase
MPSLKIDGDRLWESLMSLAEIGATPKGGNARLALSALDGQARDLVTGWMRDAGLVISVDKIGNIFGRRPGRDNSLPPVMTGSHIDTQPTGGKFDGCYGVMAGLEVMRTLNERGVVTEAPLELVIWTNEEGARFVPVMMGSGVFAGVFPLEAALNATDGSGFRVSDELVSIGYAGDSEMGHPVSAYFEAHIEQGPILEANGNTIGVVTGSLGLRWYEVTIRGFEAHAGPTPMSLRKDALWGATFLIQEVISIAHEFAPHGRGTVGVVDIHPASRNVIPGMVKFTVDIRHLDVESLNQMDARFRSACAALRNGSTTGIPLEVVVEDIQYCPPTPFDTEMIERVRQEALIRDYASQDIVTGAGHDAVYIASVAPTAMIFVPCRDGISHNEIEDAAPADLEAGANVLLGALIEQAGS